MSEHGPGRTARRQAVYRRRRLVAGMLLALVVLLVVLVGRALDGGDTAAAPSGSEATPTASPAAPTESPAPTEPAAPTQTATPGPAENGDTEPVEPTATAPACDPAALQLTATADAGSYPLDAEQARLGLTVRSTSDAECSVDAGSAQVELLVVSGDDRIWSSDDCQPSAGSAPTDVPAGGELAAGADWPLVRSAAGCADDLPPLQPGTYQLTGRLGELVSEPLVLQVG